MTAKYEHTPLLLYVSFTFFCAERRPWCLSWQSKGTGFQHHGQRQLHLPNWPLEAKKTLIREHRKYVQDTIAHINFVQKFDQNDAADYNITETMLRLQGQTSA